MHGDTLTEGVQVPNVEERANWLSRISFWFLNPLLKTGAQRTLEHDDLHKLRAQDQAGEITRKFREIWSAEREAATAAGRKPSYSRALRKLMGAGNLAYIIVMSLILSIVPFAGPLLLQAIIRFLTSPSIPDGWGVLWVIIMVLIQMVGILVECSTNRALISAGLQWRAATNNMVYWKSLVLSNSERQSESTGKIVQLMSVDAEQIFMFSYNINQMIQLPIQFFLAVALLAVQLRVAVVIGLVVMFLMTPYNGVIAKRMQRWNVAKTLAADNRVKLINEVLMGMKVIKFSNYENAFFKRVVDARGVEIKTIRALAYTQAALMFGILLSPSLIFLASIGSYAGIYGGLTIEIVFVSNSLFNLLRMPITQLPMIIMQTVLCKTSVQRIESFLLKKEVVPTHADDQKKERISVSGAKFAWSQLAAVPGAPKPGPAAGAGAAGVPPTPGSPSAKPPAGVPAPQPVAPSRIATPKGARADATVIPDEPPPPYGAIVPGGALAEDPEKEKEPFSLSGVSMSVSDGDLIMVVGSVGSGKSSLVSGILGEMECKEGTVRIAGRVAYVPQTAWIMNATLRANVIFGSPFDQAKYDEVIRVCALQPDIAILTDGDMTEIGERGINLSGGQKQRVALARAVYANADIYLFDDPLSAVDAHVADHLFRECITGPLLRNKTRLLTTNHLQYLPHADRIACLSDGRVSECGSFQTLIGNRGAFARMYEEHMGAQRRKGASLEESEDDEAVTEAQKEASAARKAKKKDAPVSPAAKKGFDAPVKKLIVDEEKNQGVIEWRTIKSYIKGLGGIGFFVAWLLLFTFSQAATVGGDLWLSYWTSGALAPLGPQSIGFYVGIYALFTIAFAVISFFREMVWAQGMVRVADTIHSRVLRAVLRSPMSFFDTTPLGRILNRFSKDLAAIDTGLPMQVNLYVSLLFIMLGTVITVSIVTYYFVIALVPIVIFYILVQRYYRHSSLALKRLDSVSRSPVYQSFSETLIGVESIRAYQREEEFQRENERRLDKNHEAFLLQYLCNFWLAIRLVFLGSLLVLACGLAVVLTRGKINVGLASMAVTMIIGLTGLMRFNVQIGLQAEQQFNSVERLETYAELPSEAPLEVPSNPVPADWPHGGVEFKDFSLRYREGLELVLKKVNLVMKAGEKVGVVGRTGSGKSSLMVALFRLVEAAGGQVLIDGVDIGKIGLADLRNHLAIIPQDPTLFVGTVRSNLDPFDDYTDAQVNEALEIALLKNHVEGLPGGLHAPISEGGSNFSVGQRQLVCLARAVLRKPKILVLDEATASVDFSTDAAIQVAVRRAFKDCTTLTIAHRLKTIMDSDKIIVLDAGNVVEYDAPSTLLKRGGEFSSLVDATGPEAAAQLRAMASRAITFEESIRTEMLEDSAGRGSYQETPTAAGQSGRPRTWDRPTLDVSTGRMRETKNGKNDKNDKNDENGMGDMKGNGKGGRGVRDGKEDGERRRKHKSANRIEEGEPSAASDMSALSEARSYEYTYSYSEPQAPRDDEPAQRGAALPPPSRELSRSERDVSRDERYSQSRDRDGYSGVSRDRL